MGMSCAQAAAHFAVSHSSAIRWTRRMAETGSPAARPMGGKQPFALANEDFSIKCRATIKVRTRDNQDEKVIAWLVP